MPAVTQRRVLAAAVASVAEQGFQVSTAALAARARVGEATLFRVLPTKQALLAATYPYVLDQLTAPVLARVPSPGESLQALLGRWWEAAAVGALARPEVFACWRQWRAAPSAPAGVAYGPFAPARALLQQALGPVARRGLRLPPPAVVPTLTAQWQLAVELANAGQPSPNPLASRPLRQALYASWWASTGLGAELLAVPPPHPLAPWLGLIAPTHPPGPTPAEDF